MAVRNTPEEKQIMRLIEALPFADDAKDGWVSAIRESGFSEELGEEIHKKITEAEAVPERDPSLVRLGVELTALTRRWRLARASKNFSKR